MKALILSICILLRVMMEEWSLTLFGTKGQRHKMDFQFYCGTNPWSSSLDQFSHCISFHEIFLEDSLVDVSSFRSLPSMLPIIENMIKHAPKTWLWLYSKSSFCLVGLIDIMWVVNIILERCFHVVNLKHWNKEIFLVSFIWSMKLQNQKHWNNITYKGNAVFLEFWMLILHLWKPHMVSCALPGVIPEHHQMCPPQIKP